ncbi:hypothetical protein D3C76_1867620 [compost metagenome]
MADFDALTKPNDPAAAARTDVAFSRIPEIARMPERKMYARHNAAQMIIRPACTGNA